MVRHTPPNSYTAHHPPLHTMGDTPAPASMSAALPRPSLSLREILLIHFVIYQEAVFAMLFQEIVIPTTWVPYKHRVHQYTWNTRSAFKHVDTARFTTNLLYRAIIMRFECDTFCLVMEPFVQRNLQKLLDTTIVVNPVVFIAKPSLRAIERLDELEQVHHSCLMVIEDNRKLIFDGTIDQYGLPWETHWLLTEEELIASHMEEGGYISRSDSGRDGWDSCRRYISGKRFGYWTTTASQRMAKLFETLDWESLRGRSEVDLVSAIRIIAKRRFVGAYEETLSQVGRTSVKLLSKTSFPLRTLTLFRTLNTRAEAVLLLYLTIMANTKTATSSPLSLREILHIYLLCFDAAADAIPLEPVAYTVPCRHPGISVPIWQVWTCKDLTEDRREIVMDGTLRQYLWAKSTWLQSKENWEAKRVDKTHGGRGYEIASQDYKEVDEQLLSRVDMGFWLIARQRMKSLFEELDWQELEGLEAGERIERVKQIAQDKFAGAWEEACDLHKQAYEED
ncbi:hypothetical protein GMOD_00007871 [Pyrenophora seminiperda CCB06]|uniref:Uncharacterized protein n=1 Tax=Pyrenophora seminiperda CCB06 TaxID=1302712 RepID=A0A3M7MFT3_9PLEO|nr:hypothetical protein GMOD_00007871 [Pyrenophora seminiperda CCB06]